MSSAGFPNKASKFFDQSGDLDRNQESSDSDVLTIRNQNRWLLYSQIYYTEFSSARVFDKIKTLFFICRLPEDSTLIHVFYSDLKVFKYSTQQLYSSYDILGKQFYTMTIYLLTVKIIFDWRQTFINILLLWLYISHDSIIWWFDWFVYRI